MKTIHTYSAHDASNDGITFEHTGTLSGAIRKAKDYARDAFPAWTEGYGPKIVIADESGDRVHEERL